MGYPMANSRKRMVLKQYIKIDNLSSPNDNFRDLETGLGLGKLMSYAACLSGYIGWPYCGWDHTNSLSSLASTCTPRPRNTSCAFLLSRSSALSPASLLRPSRPLSTRELIFHSSLSHLVDPHNAYLLIGSPIVNLVTALSLSLLLWPHPP